MSTRVNPLDIKIANPSLDLSLCVHSYAFVCVLLARLGIACGAPPFLTIQLSDLGGRVFAPGPLRAWVLQHPPCLGDPR